MKLRNTWPTTLFAFVMAIVVTPSVAMHPFHFNTPDKYPHGLASDGEHLWHTDYEARRIYKLEDSGSVVLSFDFDWGNPRGIAIINDKLYVATADNIYIIAATNGQYLAHLSSPVAGTANHQGLAFGAGKLWIASRHISDARIYAIDPDTGQSIVEFHAPGPNPRGLTYHNDLLWLLESTHNRLYCLSPEDGEILSSHTIPLSNPRGLTWHRGVFVQTDYLLALVMEINLEHGFADVYIAPQRLYQEGHSYWLPYISSHSLNHADETIRRVLIFQHGIGDDAVDHFGRALLAAKAKGVAGETLIVAPQLLSENRLTRAPPSNMLYWATPNPRFWGALSASASATYPRTERFSSFALYDHLLHILTIDPTLFPNLEEIVLSGHSGGGQFVNRYAISSPFQDDPTFRARNIDMIYIVMNPSSYAYHDDLRIDLSTLNIEAGHFDYTVPVSPPAGYNNFGYGLDALYSYHGTNNAVALRARYPQRKVIYLIGEHDTAGGDLDIDPRAMLQGTNRYERSIIHYEHLKAHYGTGSLLRHRHAVVQGVGHNSLAMITSEVGLQYHFQGPLRIDLMPMSSNGAAIDIEWRGGDGSAYVLTSDDLKSWISSGIATNTPFRLDLSPHNRMHFYKLEECSGP